MKTNKMLSNVWLKNSFGLVQQAVKIYGKPGWVCRTDQNIVTVFWLNTVEIKFNTWGAYGTQLTPDGYDPVEREATTELAKKLSNKVGCS